MSKETPPMELGKRFTDDAGRVFCAVRNSDSVLHSNCFALIDTQTNIAQWIPPPALGMRPPLGHEYGVNANEWSISPRHFFWAMLYHPNIVMPWQVSNSLWTLPQGNYIIGVDPANGPDRSAYVQQKMDVPHFLPGQHLLKDDSRKCWIVKEFADGLPAMLEESLKWNQVIFSSRELRMIPLNEWAALGLRVESLSIFGYPVELWETRGYDGCLNLWYVECLSC